MNDKKKNEEKSVNFPRDWLVTRFFMAFHCGVRSACLYVLSSVSLGVYHHHDSYCTCNFVLAVFLSFYSSTTSLCELYMRKEDDEEEEEAEGEEVAWGEKTLWSCVCVCVLMVEQFAISFKWNKP